MRITVAELRRLRRIAEGRISAADVASLARSQSTRRHISGIASTARTAARYARGDFSGIGRALLGKLGALGGLFDLILESFGPNETVDLQDLEAAARLLGSAGFGVTPPGGGVTAAPGAEEPAPRRDEIGRFTSRRTPIGAPPLPGEESPEFHRTTGSSNAWGFSYNPYESTLYVTYLAPKLNPKGVTFDKKTGTLKGTRGKTISGKRNAPGATYAYLDVPARVYKRFQLAASAGKFVWDELRIRGSIWGHKYRYHLTSGAIAPNTGAPGGIYVPRRATKVGFRNRALPSLGTGRRSFVRNTIGEERFTTRRGGG